jgi:hypothetical protein
MPLINKKRREQTIKYSSGSSSMASSIPKMNHRTSITFLNLREQMPGVIEKGNWQR